MLLRTRKIDGKYPNELRRCCGSLLLLTIGTVNWLEISHRELVFHFFHFFLQLITVIAP